MASTLATAGLWCTFEAAVVAERKLKVRRLAGARPSDARQRPRPASPPLGPATRLTTPVSSGAHRRRGPLDCTADAASLWLGDAGAARAHAARRDPHVVLLQHGRLLLLPVLPAVRAAPPPDGAAAAHHAAVLPATRQRVPAGLVGPTCAQGHDERARGASLPSSPLPAHTAAARAAARAAAPSPPPFAPPFAPPTAKAAARFRRCVSGAGLRKAPLECSRCASRCATRFH